MTRFQIDTTHSNIDFSIRHLVIAKVRGRFTTFSGTIELDAADLSRSKVSVEIDAASISTNEDKRDAHLRSADFFDVEKYPLITFTSKQVEVDGSDLRVTGALTIHGVTRDVVLEVESLGTVKDPWGNERVAFADLSNGLRAGVIDDVGDDDLRPLAGELECDLPADAGPSARDERDLGCQ